MRRLICISLCLAGFVALPGLGFAQDSSNTPAPVTFELDEEKLTIEADIPSVDLILSFREIQERDSAMKESFVDEIVDSAKSDPF